MTTPIVRRMLARCTVVALALLAPSPGVAAEGELRLGLRVTLAPEWPDPAETEAFNTPVMVRYAVMGEAVVGNLQTVSIHQIQKVMTRVGESTAGAIAGYPDTAPMEDLTLEK